MLLQRASEFYLKSGKQSRWYGPLWKNVQAPFTEYVMATVDQDDFLSALYVKKRSSRPLRRGRAGTGGVEDRDILDYVASTKASALRHCRAGRRGEDHVPPSRTEPMPARTLRAGLRQRAGHRGKRRRRAILQERERRDQQAARRARHAGQREPGRLVALPAPALHRSNRPVVDSTAPAARRQRDRRRAWPSTYSSGSRRLDLVRQRCAFLRAKRQRILVIVIDNADRLPAAFQQRLLKLGRVLARGRGSS